MYQALLDPDMPKLSPSELYAQTRAATSLAEEIRLARSHLGLALQSGKDEKVIISWLTMIHALVRTHEGLGGEDELQAMLTRIGAEIRGGIAEDGGAELSRDEV